MNLAVRNGLLCVLMLVLTLVAWWYGSPLWSHAFTMNGPYDSEWALLLFWGYEIILTVSAGFILALLVKSDRRILWVAVFGSALFLLRVRFSRTWTSPDADWTIYLEKYVHYALPLIGALLGGVLAHWTRTEMMLTRSSN